MDVRRVSSGSPWEPLVGYSRAVRAGEHVHVSGCTAVLDGEVVHEGDPYRQARRALEVVADALRELDASMEQVVRTRLYVVDIRPWPEVGRAHAEVLGGVRPASTLVQVVALVDPRLLVEVEADAWVGPAALLPGRT